MKNKFPLLTFIIVFFSFSFTKSAELLAHIDKFIFLQGKVGDKAIVIKIKCYDESPVRYMNYYFEDDKKDQYLEGNLIGNVWQFTSVDNQKEEKNLVIKEESDGSWKGFWREGSSKKINLILKPIVVYPDSKYNYYSKNKELDLYEAYKISILNLEKTKIEKISKHFELDWYLEKESGISLFRLQTENKKINLDSLNTTLEVLQLSYIQNHFHFNPNIETATIQSEVLYLNEELISFKIISNVTLKTQNPIKSQQLFTLGLKNGQQIDLESIVWFDEKNPKPAANEIMQTYQYRKKLFAPKVFSILNELYPQQMQSSDCNLNKEATWALPNFAITKQGLLFCFSTSAACNLIDWAIIPYGKLTPYLDKKYKLN